jgi:hypothetical protein
MQKIKKEEGNFKIISYLEQASWHNISQFSSLNKDWLGVIKHSYLK